MSIAIIAAVAQNGVVGKDNVIPWHIPEDMRRFKTLTMGHPVAMGRKTFESIVQSLGTPLPGRKNVVITRQADYRVPQDVEVCRSFDDALVAHAAEEIFVIGGAEIYRQAIDRADTLYITHVEQNVDGDAYFPKISNEEWKLASEERHEGYRFATYKRKV